jgi:hypothetical protein
MAAAWVVWSRREQHTVAGPFLASQDATDAIKRLKGKRVTVKEDVYDSVAVTI